jgi:hypothetical protein
MDGLLNERTTIQRDDVFLVSVESRDQALTIITERGNGTVTVPHVGSIRLQGLTLGQAREAIQQAVAARRADVIVRLWVYRDR